MRLDTVQSSPDLQIRCSQTPRPGNRPLHCCQTMSQPRTPQLGADYPGEQYYTGPPPPSHYPSHYYPAPYPAHYPPPPLTSYETAPPPGEFSPHSDSSSHSPNSFEHTYHPYYAQVKHLRLLISNCLNLGSKSPSSLFIAGVSIFLWRRSGSDPSRQAKQVGGRVEQEGETENAVDQRSILLAQGLHP